MLVKNVENIVADLGELVLNLLAVLLDESNLSGVALGLLLLLDGSDYSPRRTAGTDDVLVGDGEEIALLNAQIAVLGGDNLHVLDHLWKRVSDFLDDAEAVWATESSRTLIALGLLCELSQVDGVFLTHFGDFLKVVIDTVVKEVSRVKGVSSGVGRGINSSRSSRLGKTNKA